jgi:plasmid stabilization system protein ParE
VQKLRLSKPISEWYRDRNPQYADQWFRGLMNTIATLQEKPQRCTLAVEHEIFPEEVRQLMYGKAKNTYRILFSIRNMTVFVLYVRHGAQSPLTPENLENDIQEGR